jgi:hypothetical protein
MGAFGVTSRFVNGELGTGVPLAALPGDRVCSKVRRKKIYGSMSDFGPILRFYR